VRFGSLTAAKLRTHETRPQPAMLAPMRSPDNTRGDLSAGARVIPARCEAGVAGSAGPARWMRTWADGGPVSERAPVA